MASGSGAVGDLADTSWVDDFSDDDATSGASPRADALVDGVAAMEVADDSEDEGAAAGGSGGGTHSGASPSDAPPPRAPSSPPSPTLLSPRSSDPGAYLDFSVKSPWERLSTTVEAHFRRWLRASADDLRRWSARCDRAEHGGRHLLRLRARIDHGTHWRRDPYCVSLYYRPEAPPNVLAPPLITDPQSASMPHHHPRRPHHPRRREKNHRRVESSVLLPPSSDLASASSGVERWLGLAAPFVIVEPAHAFGGRFGDVDEAAAIRAATADALASAGAPTRWPTLAPVGGTSSGAFVGGSPGAGADGCWAMRLETDSLEGKRAEESAARTLRGLAKTLDAHLRATSAGDDGFFGNHFDGSFSAAGDPAAEDCYEARSGVEEKEIRGIRREDSNAAAGTTTGGALTVSTPVATASARLTFPTDRRRALRVLDRDSGRSDASDSADAYSDADSDSGASDSASPGAAFMAMAEGAGTVPRRSRRRREQGDAAFAEEEEKILGSTRANADPGAAAVVSAGEMETESTAASAAARAAARDRDRRNRRSSTLLALERRRLEWDAAAPWTPWANLRDPFVATEIDATWRAAPLADVLRAELAPASAPEWTLRAVPRGAEGVLGAAAWGWTNANAFYVADPSSSSGGSVVAADASGSVSSAVAGEGGSNLPLGVGLAELYYLLSRQSSARALADAEDVGSLASDDFWDDPRRRAGRPKGPRGAGDDSFVDGVPRAPPESVVQDVLRDVFDAVNKKTRSGSEAVPKRTEGTNAAKAAEIGSSKTTAEGTAADRGDATEERAPDDEDKKTKTTGGVALGGKNVFAAGWPFLFPEEGDSGDAERRDASCTHVPASALFPNPPRSAPPDGLLARVALHALQFGNVRAVAILWRRFVRELRFAHWDRGVPLPRMGRELSVSDDDSAHDPALDQPDVSACPLHQMLQLLDACIRRRKVASRAALDASDVAKEARERARDANIPARAGKISVVGGWDDVGGGWNDDEDDAHEEAPREDDLDLTSLLGVGADVGKVVGKVGGSGEAPNGADANEDAGAAAADSSPSSPRSPSNSVSGFETASDDGDDEGLAAIADDAPPSGVLRDHPDGLALLRASPPRPLRVPITQLPAVMTEDAMREREAALEALGDTPEGRALRARVQSDVLLSDMSAFKAANPGACLADFVRWHSPKDWEEEEGFPPPSDFNFSSEGGGIKDGVKENAALSRGTVAPGFSSTRAAPRGRLSLRMRSPGNAWQTLWRDAPAAAASAQKPLFDPIREGEKCLHRLDTVPPREVFSQLLAVAAAAVGHVLASSRGAQITPAPEALRRAAERARATLARPCPYPAERDAVAGELQRAERAVARGESLLFHLPGVPRRALRALLTQAMEDDDARDEVAARVAGEEDLEEDRGEDHRRGDVEREGQSRLEEGGAVASGGAAGGERFGALDRDDEFNFAPRAVEVSLAPGLERYAAEALLPRAAVRSGRGGGGRDEDRREDREDRREDRSGNVYSLADGGMPFPSDSDGGAAEAAIVAEYALRVSGGGGARTHRAHVVAAPCFLRVSSSLAHPY